ncbi:glycosyltransferase [Aureimonas mangrovi]|uniref:glycosyltransferase n=1 Tax=Aureimonas mangrovi TaxID=2758041 RepID=UPI00163D6FBB|nr:glycosyltransferase [Aureimonas mangrovi]
MSRDGVIYIAFGKFYRDEALFSARSLKRHCDLPVTLFTDIATDDPAVDRVEIIDPTHKRAKIDYIGSSPYERTLYLDSDTMVVRDIRDVFVVLDRFNVAGVHDHSRKCDRWAKVIEEYAAIPYAFPEYNGGVLLFDASPASKAFLALWRELFHRYRDRTNGQDQATLRIALWQSGVALHSLPFEYNVRNAKIRQKMAKRARRREAGLLAPRILHWHGLDNRWPLASLFSRYRPMKY